LLCSFLFPANRQGAPAATNEEGFTVYDCLIIGCGVTGAALAYELSRYKLKVAVLEKENDVADGTTKANSAIIHAGYDPKPGTLMARLNVEGAALAKELCGKLDVPYQQIGSFVLAFDEADRETLEKLYRQGTENGVPGLELLDGDAARRLEPNLSAEVVAALHAPSAGIVSPWEYALALAETAVRNGVELYLENRVEAIEALSRGWRVTTNAGSYETRCLFNAAGIHAADIHNLALPESFRILPDRGQYYLLDKSEGTRVSKVIFQCPTKVGKGVLVSPTVHGNLIVGPNAEEIADGEDTSTTGEGLQFVKKMAMRSVPSVSFRDSIRNFAGVRAVSDQEDFILGRAAEGFYDLAGIKSPGLTAAPAIARYIVRLAGQDGLALEEKEAIIDERRRVRFQELSMEEKNALIARDPRYGRVICRCETVTEGEIAASLHTPIPPRSVDGVKRRVGAGMGRCQGGFCGPRVLELLARETGAAPDEVLQDKAGSYILVGETKTGNGSSSKD
jgi:glycerol-3-phosphate dehydrogenase